MGYLIKDDYLKQITDVSLHQLISGDDYIRQRMELTAQAEVISYLRQKYDTDTEFADTNVYSPSATYKAASRVYLDAPTYSASAIYSLNAMALQGGKVYLCTSAIDSPETFNLSHWLLLDAQYTMFYAHYPFPLFSLDGYYGKGDKVFWKDKTYECLVDTAVYSHETQLQYGSTSGIPSGNTFPGSAAWRDLGAYSVPPGSLLNSTYFAQGDNRNPQLVMATVDIVLFHLYSRVAPKSIPEQREMRYRAAKEWLKMTARGEVSADIGTIQPERGSRIRYGSRVKQKNDY